MRGRSAKLGRVEGTGEFWTGEDRTSGLLQDGKGSFTFPKGTSFEDADGAFALGEKVIFQGWMHDPRTGWSRIGAAVVVSGASYKGEGSCTLKRSPESQWRWKDDARPRRGDGRRGQAYLRPLPHLHGRCQ